MTIQSLPVTLTQSSIRYLGDLYFHSKYENQPLVVLVHEWWGKTSQLEMRARKLTEALGCASLAVDLYGEAKTASDPDEALALAKCFYEQPLKSMEMLESFVKLAFEEAKKVALHLDPQRIAAIGYCFGGTQVLNLARQPHTSLVAVVSFHGGLRSSFQTQKIHPKILVLHGHQDKMVPQEEVEAFHQEMKTSQADFKFHAYPDAEHGFTNPEATSLGKRFELPIAYDAQADQDSWEKMCLFLKDIFRV